MGTALAAPTSGRSLRGRRVSHRRRHYSAARAAYIPIDVILTSNSVMVFMFSPVVRDHVRTFCVPAVKYLPAAGRQQVLIYVAIAAAHRQCGQDTRDHVVGRDGHGLDSAAVFDALHGLVVQVGRPIVALVDVREDSRRRRARRLDRRRPGRRARGRGQGTGPPAIPQ